MTEYVHNIGQPAEHDHSDGQEGGTELAPTGYSLGDVKEVELLDRIEGTGGDALPATVDTTGYEWIGLRFVTYNQNATGGDVWLRVNGASTTSYDYNLRDGTGITRTTGAAQMVLGGLSGYQNLSGFAELYEENVSHNRTHNMTARLAARQDAPTLFSGQIGDDVGESIDSVTLLTENGQSDEVAVLVYGGSR